LRRHFNNCECSVSGGKIWELKCKNYNLDHITYSNAFSFHSSALRLMSNVTIKWYRKGD
jgi:hypothetical protein